MDGDEFMTFPEYRGSIATELRKIADVIESAEDGNVTSHVYQQVLKDEDGKSRLTGTLVVGLSGWLYVPVKKQG